MAGPTLLVLALEVAVALVRFVIAFYGFWLVLRGLTGVLSEDTLGLRDLSPLACDFTDPFVMPVSRAVRCSPWVACWLWLAVLAAVEVGLGWLPDLL